jgi:hypothetical protein
VGAPISIAGAGVGGLDHPTFVQAISGTTITLDDNAQTTVASAVVFQPTLYVKKIVFISQREGAGGNRAMFRRIGGNAGRPILIAGYTFREVGSPEPFIPHLQVSGSGGEVNTSSNAGGGIGLALPKDDLDLPFKSLTSTDSSLTIAPNVDTVDITITNPVTASRKGGQDSLGNIVTTETIDFDSGTYDNKDAVLTGNTTITLAEPTRGGRYTLYLASDVDGTARQITWVLGGTAAWGPVAQGNIPSYVSSGGVMKIELEYDLTGGLWLVDPVGEVEVTVDGATQISGTWQPDFGFGVGRYHRITNSTPAGVTFDIPLNMPINETMIIHFESSQANPPTISLNPNLIQLSAIPTWTNTNAVLVLHRSADKYLLTMSNKQ